MSSQLWPELPRQNGPRCPLSIRNQIEAELKQDARLESMIVKFAFAALLTVASVYGADDAPSGFLSKLWLSGQANVMR